LLLAIVNVTLCVLSAINKSILNRIIEQIPIDQFRSETAEAKWKNIFGDSLSISVDWYSFVGSSVQLIYRDSFFACQDLMDQQSQFVITDYYQGVATSQSEFRSELQ
jgi:hypothetical protein